MKFAFLLGLGVCVFLPQRALPCSAFFLETEEGPSVAKSYDWYRTFDHGAVFTNARGVEKSALLSPKAPSTSFAPPVKWKSLYGSITFNQFGIEFPMGGMNEKGLVVEVLQLRSSEYPPSEDPRPFINESEWVQYQLDRSANTAEVLQSLERVKVDGLFTGVHYFICDLEGRCAVIEFLDGKVITFTGEGLPLPALTNHSFAESYEYFQKNRSKLDSWQTSLPRFSRIAQALTSFSRAKPSPASRSFEILSSVKQNLIHQSAWNIVYLPKEGKIRFRTRQVPAIRELKVGDFDFTCKTRGYALDMNAPPPAAPSKFTAEFNHRILQKNSLLLPKELLKAAEEHPQKSFRCAE